MHYYTLDNHLLIQTERETIFVEPWELEILEKESRQLEQFQDSHILSVFPEAKSCIKQLIKGWKELQRKYEELRVPIRDIILKHIHTVADQEYAELLTLQVYVEIPQEKLQQKIDKLARMLEWANHKKTTNLEKAKLYPITDLIGFNAANFAICIWHKEYSPSLKYYPKTNTVYCFACQKHGDAIAVYQQLHQCPFREAIKALS